MSLRDRLRHTSKEAQVKIEEEKQKTIQTNKEMKEKALKDEYDSTHEEVRKNLKNECEKAAVKGQNSISYISIDTHLCDRGYPPRIKAVIDYAKSVGLETSFVFNKGWGYEDGYGPRNDWYDLVISWEGDKAP